MSRPVTLFTGQWADLPLTALAEKAAAWGYDGLELACWGAHLDVLRAAEDPDYCVAHRDCLLYTSPSPRDATLSRMPSSA